MSRYESGVSCGAFLVNERNEVLILHSTFDDGFEMWSVPKGLQERNETKKQAAIREIGEETGIELSNLNPLAETTYKRGSKRLVLFWKQLDSTPAVDLDFENDGYQWADLDTARRELYYVQAEYITLLKTHLDYANDR